MITSSANQQMKRVIQLNKKSKTRLEQRVFVAEGIKMCLEAPKESIEAMYVAESLAMEIETSEERRRQFSGYAYEVVADRIFQTISDTKTPQGVLCLVKMPEYRLEDLLGDGQKRKAAHLIILESIQDPGNLGTMIRTGEGAGITGIIMNQTTADIYQPKAVRATMGSLYRVPFYITSSLPNTIRELKEKGVALYAAHLAGDLSYDRPDYTGAIGFLIGNEGKGLSPETAALADYYIRIPMEGKVESLNAAVAAALLMYETNRQRR